MATRQEKWKTFIRSSDLKTFIFKAINLSLLNSLLPLITVFLVFLTVDRTLYGLYHFLFNVIGIAELFLVGLDASILRFWTSKEVSSDDKKRIVQVVFILKFMVTSFVLSCFFLLSLFPAYVNPYLPKEATNINYLPYLYVAFGITFVSSLQSTLTKFFIANKMFRYMARLTIIRESVAFIFISVLLLYFKASYLAVILVHLFVYSLVLVINLIHILRHREDFYISFQLSSRQDYLHIYREYLKNYSIPLSLSSAFTYAKNQLPTVILSYAPQPGALKLSGEYSFIQTRFRQIHKLSSGYLGYLLPKFIDMYETHPKDFAKKFNTLFQFSSLFRVTIFMGTFLLGNVFLILLNMPLHYDFILLIFAIELLFADIATFNANVIHFSKNTKFLLYSSFYRAIVEIPMIFILTFWFGGVGAAITLLFSRMVESYVLIHYANRFKLLQHQKFIFGVFALLVCLSIFMYRGRFCV